MEHLPSPIPEIFIIQVDTFYLAPGEAIDRPRTPCSWCLNDGKPHTVEVATSAAVVESNGEYFDEEGVFHVHSWSNRARSYVCSNNHHRTERFITKCPSCGWTLDQEA